MHGSSCIIVSAEFIPQPRMQPIKRLLGVSFCFVYYDEMEKEFKSYDEQIKLLKSKKLIINDYEHAKGVLKNIGYFALINGYKRPFKENDGTYKSGTCFEDIEQLYYFDERLRTIILEHLLLVERTVKSSISYYFSQDNKGVNEYFNLNCYNYRGRKNIEEINRLVLILLNAYSDEKHSYIKHYKEKHNGEIPLWVLMNAMTFGQVSKMYSLLKVKTQQKICGDFNITSNSDMAKMLNMITLFRNVCAHNERLYDYKVTTGVKLDYVKSNITVSGNYTYENERKSLFGMLICCKCFEEGMEGISCFRDLAQMIDNSPAMKNSNISGIILKKMGLPQQWRQIE